MFSFRILPVGKNRYSCKHESNIMNASHLVIFTGCEYFFYFRTKFPKNCLSSFVLFSFVSRSRSHLSSNFDNVEAKWILRLACFQSKLCTTQLKRKVFLCLNSTSTSASPTSAAEIFFRAALPNIRFGFLVFRRTVIPRRTAATITTLERLWRRSFSICAFQCPYLDYKYMCYNGMVYNSKLC